MYHKTLHFKISILKKKTKKMATVKQCRLQEGIEAIKDPENRKDKRSCNYVV